MQFKVFGLRETRLVANHEREVPPFYQKRTQRAKGKGPRDGWPSQVIGGYLGNNDYYYDVLLFYLRQ